MKKIAMFLIVAVVSYLSWASTTAAQELNFGNYSVELVSVPVGEEVPTVESVINKIFADSNSAPVGMTEEAALKKACLLTYDSEKCPEENLSNGDELVVFVPVLSRKEFATKVAEPLERQIAELKGNLAAAEIVRDDALKAREAIATQVVTQTPAPAEPKVVTKVVTRIKEVKVPNVKAEAELVAMRERISAIPEKVMKMNAALSSDMRPFVNPIDLYGKRNFFILLGVSVIMLMFLLRRRIKNREPVPELPESIREESETESEPSRLQELMQSLMIANDELSFFNLTIPFVFHFDGGKELGEHDVSFEKLYVVCVNGKHCVVLKSPYDDNVELHLYRGNYRNIVAHIKDHVTQAVRQAA